MNIESLTDALPDYARDTKLNLQAVLQVDPSSGLTLNQTIMIGLACAYAVRSPSLVSMLVSQFKLDDATIEAAKASATIMAMNNVYYRFLHLAEDKEFSKMPARLRMNIIGKPPVAKPEFELMCLAVSALAGCGNCINAHIAEAKKGGFSGLAIQTVARIAAVVNAWAQAEQIQKIA